MIVSWTFGGPNELCAWWRWRLLDRRHHEDGVEENIKHLLHFDMELTAQAYGWDADAFIRLHGGFGLGIGLVVFIGTLRNFLARHVEV